MTSVQIITRWHTLHIYGQYNDVYLELCSHKEKRKHTKPRACYNFKNGYEVIIYKFIVTLYIKLQQSHSKNNGISQSNNIALQK